MQLDTYGANDNTPLSYAYSVLTDGLVSAVATIIASLIRLDAATAFPHSRHL